MIGNTYTSSPIEPDFFHTAVLCRPPRYFSVKILSTIEYEAVFGCEILISPTTLDGASGLSSSTYRVWRSWSDCLMFQDRLRLEYRRMAMSKKRRLVAGKGIKKNGIYIHDRAASFESLPNGPDPKSVHLDVHQCLPKLTNKNTFFRPAPATLNQRQKELEALLEVLLSPDSPTLLHELLQVPVIRDFFGLWRRDYNRAIDLNRVKPVNRSSTSSLPVSPASPKLEPSPSHSPSKPSSQSTQNSSSRNDFLQRGRSKHLESTSCGSSSVAPSSNSGRSDHSPSVIVSQESLTLSGHRPEQGPRHYHDPGVAALRTLPEEDDDVLDLSVKSGRENVRLSTAPRMRKTPGPRAKRGAQIFTTTPIPPTDSPADPVCNNDGESIYAPDRMSMVSASDYLEQLGLSFENHDQDKSSRSSVATFRTTCSADAVIPRLPSRIDNAQSLCDSPQNRPNSILDDFTHNRANSESWTTCDELSFHDSSPSERSSGDYSGSNSIRRFNFFRPRSNTSTTSSSSASSLSTSLFGGSTQDDARSFTETVASSVIYSPPPSPTETLTIKAALDNSIVVLRVPRTICFDEIRQRLYDKFVRQEGVPLSKCFDVTQIITTASVSSPTRSVFARRQPRPNGVSTSGVSDSIQMRRITSQEEWEQAIRCITSSEKLTLRVVRDSS